MSLHRPEPRDPSGSSPVDASTSPVTAARRLAAGETLRITDSWSTGKRIQGALQSLEHAPPETADHLAKRAWRRRLTERSSRLLAPVVRRRVELKDAPVVGFLDDLYPEDELHLAFSDVQALIRAWHAYANGVKLTVLGFALHPFWGTYAPSRTEHLELFGTWLSSWSGPRGHAVDVGTGCGVLAFQLANAGFGNVTATDDNPNAVESVRRALTRFEPRPPIRPVVGDLLADAEPADLIVFDPPWTPGDVEDLLDRALYYDDPALFVRFFDQAVDRLNPGGRVAVVFSDIATLVRPDAPHPIETELAQGRFTLAEKLRRRVKGQPGRRTKERVELWVLERA